MAKTGTEIRDLVFVFEWRVQIEQQMSLNLEEVMEKMQETGGCKLTDVRVEPTEFKR